MSSTALDKLLAKRPAADVAADAAREAAWQESKAKRAAMGRQRNITDFLRRHYLTDDAVVHLRRGEGQGPLPLISKWTEADVMWALLEARSGMSMVNIPQFRLMDGKRSMDLFSISVGEWGGDCRRTGYEIKVSKADFASEMRTPAKYVEAMRFCDFYNYVTPPGIIDPPKLPPRAGLIEVSQDHRKGWLGRWRSEVIVKPLHCEPQDTRELVKSLAANCGLDCNFRGMGCLGKRHHLPFEIQLKFDDENLPEILAQVIAERKEQEAQRKS